jgi:dTDP-glucose 4,6-dehydratase
MRILVTGGCGFIGSHFINMMVTNGYYVVNVDKMDYCSNVYNIKVDCKTYTCDILDRDKMIQILREHNINTIVHFAAQTFVDTSFDDSINFTRDNVLGTHTLLETCREYGFITKFIHVSTDEVYGETLNIVNEGDPLDPTNPYAATKAAAEFIVKSYWHSFKMPIIIVRMNNVYGENQYHEKVIPRFISQLKNDQKCTIHGKGQTRRSFIHVYDVCQGIFTVMNKGVISEIYNIGTDKEIGILELAEKIIYYIKKSSQFERYIEFVNDRPYNDYRYYINSNKLKKLGWSETKIFDDELFKLTTS